MTTEPKARRAAALTRLLVMAASVALCTAYLAQAQTGDEAPKPAGSETPAAGDAPRPGAGAADTQGVIPTKSLIAILKSGGIVMIPLLGCSFVLLAVMFERLIMLRRGRIIPRPFVKRFMHQVREGNLEPAQALMICEENGSPVSDVFAAAVRKWGRPSVEVEQAVLDAGERAVNHLRRYLRVFNAIATVSPLLGLLGTVFGMIRTFNEIATLDAMGSPDKLAKGISEALIATASGLTIAIPALILYMYFLSRVDTLVIELDAAGQELVDVISSDSGNDRTTGRRRGSREAAA